MNLQSKMLALPAEVFGMIIKELFKSSQEISKEVVLRHSFFLNATSLPYWADLLRPIIQTCRTLRALYAPMYYEQVEVCMVRTGKVWWLQLSERMERTSKVLMAPEMSELAANVRVLTVSLMRNNQETAVPLFASCLSALPNLHTLRILHTQSKMAPILKTTFEGRRYTQIRTIIVPMSARDILRACPEVRDVTCNQRDSAMLIGVIQKDCKHVEVVDGIRFDKPRIATRFRNALPDLREVFIRDYDSLCNMQALIGLKNLAVIRINLLDEGFLGQDTSSWVEKSMKKVEEKGGFVTEARAVLKKSAAPQPEKLVEVHWERSERYTTYGGDHRTVVHRKQYNVGY